MAKIEPLTLIPTMAVPVVLGGAGEQVAAWARGQPLTVHGWIYGLKDGLMHDLGCTVHRAEDLGPRYLGALQALQAAAALDPSHPDVVDGDWCSRFWNRRSELI